MVCIWWIPDNNEQWQIWKGANFLKAKCFMHQEEKQININPTEQQQIQNCITTRHQQVDFI